MRKAGLVAGALALVVAGGAWLFHEPRAKGPLDAYLRLGTSTGAAALQRDLVAEFPPGAPFPALRGRLQALGLACQPAAEPGAWRCQAWLLQPSGIRMRVEVVPRLVADRLLGLEVAFDDRNNPANP